MRVQTLASNRRCSSAICRHVSNIASIGYNRNGFLRQGELPVDFRRELTRDFQRELTRLEGGLGVRRSSSLGVSPAIFEVEAVVAGFQDVAAIGETVDQVRRDDDARARGVCLRDGKPELRRRR